ncbi:MAG: hypothetical protein AB8B87_15190 [Granulosicoccus sp.]
MQEQESEKDLILNDAEKLCVKEALESILATEKFEAAPQMSAFLRYVVEQTADGNQSRIKAFTVAVDALGKPDTFDPQNDPVVRVLAGRLRAALSAYNDENEDAPLMITMKPGSYVPSFTHRESKSKECINYAGRTHSQGTPIEADVTLPGSTVTPDPTTITIIEDSLAHAPMHSDDVQASAVDTTSYSAPDALHESPYTSSNSQGLLDRMLLLVTRAPGFALAAALLAAVTIASLQNPGDGSIGNEPDIQAAVASNPEPDNGLRRQRPESPSVFINAFNRGNVLENTLNAVVSGAMSESEQVRVYRILDTERETRFWPEDYILTLTVLDLPDETRVNMQLMKAETGHIVHSSVMRLNELAFEQLTQEELTTLIDTARSMVSESGPLMTDYLSKNNASTKQ